MAKRKQAEKLDGSDLQGTALQGLTLRERIIFGAILGVSNLGVNEKPTVKQVAKWLQDPKLDLQHCVLDFAQSIIETDEMLVMFMEEAESWRDEQLKTMLLSDVRRIWPDVIKLYDDALALVAK
jgi:hypothetical protein